MSLLTAIFGDPNERVIAKIRPIIAEINKREEASRALRDDDFSLRIAEIRQEIQNGKPLDEALPEVFSLVREASQRTTGLRHFDVQLIGGVVLHRGQIAEMKTGEGKTLVATLAAALNALSGNGVHVVTVNDYLAKRDSLWMGPIFNLLGLSVASIQHEKAFRYQPLSLHRGELVEVRRNEAYACDITYGTNNEFGFDYLRDNMAYSLEQMTQRGQSYAIVDEVDSILIDEARTPLIISAPAEESAKLYETFARLVVKLKENEDYNIDLKMHAATLTEAGIAKMEQWLGVDNLYAGGVQLAHHLEEALKAHALYKLDRDYVVKDGEIIIVDEFTGRLMMGRRYSEGLHQAIEAKEGVRVQEESQTMATVTFQNYFRLYKKLAGMTGTAITEAEEFSKIYKLEVVAIPTNKPMIRANLPDRIYKTEKGKFVAVAKEIAERHQKGQPVLVGTISIQKNEQLSAVLSEAGIPHQVLNAKNHEREATIIADAGRAGAVTVATNMAGRGVDIILGGTMPTDLDNPEQTQAAMASWQVEHDKVVSLGGLLVIGTERHEARRIDNQLRGRAGRQGDPGSSQFYVSLEDELMHKFGTDKVKGLMDRMGIPEDMPVENRMVSRAIEAAQHKVEGHNFDIRKHVVEYDDVINKHREVVYKKRREFVSGAPEENRQRLTQMIAEEMERVVSFHTAGETRDAWNLQEIIEVVRTIMPVPEGVLLELESMTAKNENPVFAREAILKRLSEILHFHYDNFVRSIEDLATGGRVGACAELEKAVLLRTLDGLWIEHLDAIDHLREGIGLRGYGQHDPLVEYKREAFRMLSELIALFEKEVVYSIFKVGLQVLQSRGVFDRRGVTFSAPAKTADGEGSSPTSDLRPPIFKVGRNDPCYCGSGKKFKRCHGA